MPDHIYLYGVSGSGKTTISSILASSLGLPRYDLDEEIENATGMSIESIFNSFGEDRFREYETNYLNQLSNYETAVIALGGGTLLSEANRNIAESSGTVICLEASIESLHERLSSSHSNRPLISDDLSSKLPKLLENRKAHYESFRFKLNTTFLSPEEVAWQIKIMIGRFRISNLGLTSEIRIQSALLTNIDRFIPGDYHQRNTPIITDNNVAKLYGHVLLKHFREKHAHLLVIPAGENSKSLEQLSNLWSEMLLVGIDRKSTLFALGGGVVGDLAGFAAATFMRGIPWINLPTTLLAQVDAGIGAKTGINLEQGKNLVGAFHVPEKVLIDPWVLRTLPQDELSNGFAEIIKHAIIGDQILYKKCQQVDIHLRDEVDEFISRAAAVKIKIVSEDPFEENFRQALNFGHTIGHAIEKNMEYRMKHGEAVSIGMVAETFISEKIGLAERGLHDQIGQLLETKNLPTKIPDNLDSKNVIESIYFDKKRDRGKILFALPEQIGTVKIGINVDNLDKLIKDFRESYK